MTRRGFILSGMCALLLAASPVWAKRPWPAEVEPVVYAGVKYTAPHFQKGPGIVEAWDIKTNTRLWELRVYKIRYNPFIEKDVQDVFITSLAVKDGRLIVTNEKNKVYEVDLETRKVRRIK